MNLFPSFFFPLIAKKISFFFISLELILACFKLRLENIFLSPDSYLIILNLKLSDKVEFFIFIDLRIFFLSERKIFFNPSS